MISYEIAPSLVSLILIMVSWHFRPADRKSCQLINNRSSSCFSVYQKCELQNKLQKSLCFQQGPGRWRGAVLRINWLLNLKCGASHQRQCNNAATTPSPEASECEQTASFQHTSFIIPQGWPIAGDISPRSLYGAKRCALLSAGVQV
jgi:hypothetical protein